MNYLSVENLTKSYGDILLFKDISLHVNIGEKIALVGANGSGKSSILRIITGEDIPDEGTIDLNNNISVGYLKQDPVFNDEHTVEEAIYSSEHPILQTVKEYDYCLNHVEEISNERMEAAMATMEENKAWDFNVKVEQIISKLKLDTITQQVKYLSGGQKKRIDLAQILIEDHDFLILDEPTNHLDLEMIEWLE